MLTVQEQAWEVARREGKRLFLFIVPNWERMRERGNTHYCFACGGKFGFTPNPEGMPTKHTDDSYVLYNPMENHTPITHAMYTVGEADRFDNPWDWLNSQISHEFPFIVTIPKS